MNTIRSALARIVEKLKGRGEETPSTPTARVPRGVRPGDERVAAGDERVAQQLRDAGADVEAYDPHRDMPHDESHS